jgi:hypothetical protein
MIELTDSIIHSSESTQFAHDPRWRFFDALFYP